MLFKTCRALSFLEPSRKTRLVTMVYNRYHMESISSKHQYEDAVSTLNSLQTNASVLQQAKRRVGQLNTNVEDTRKYLQRSGISQEMLDSCLSAIHVAGTKGKGSTCAFTESILRHHGFRTGFYSSPHLVAVRERIRINGKPLSMEKFTHYFWDVYNSLLAKQEHDGDMPPYFKFLTVMAFNVFIKENVDVAVIEVGIGGELDCTNVIQKPVVVGITSLGLDHTSLLGNTVELIARQKAGILKPNVPGFTVQNQPGKSLSVIQKRATDIGCEVAIAPAIQSYLWPNDEILTLGLDSEVQYLNASLAIQLAHTWLNKQQKTAKRNDVFEIPVQTAQGLANVVWPGRAQIIKDTPLLKFFLDGAHTTESIINCLSWFKAASKRESNGKKVTRTLLFNSTGERDSTNLLQPLCSSKTFDKVLFSPNISSTKQNADQNNFMVTEEQQLKRANSHVLAWKSIGGDDIDLFDVQAFPSVSDAIAFTRKLSTLDEVHVLVTGSLHLVGCVLGQLVPEEETEELRENAKLQ